MKTIYFYGLTETSLAASMMLNNVNIEIYARYHFGSLAITFELKDRKELGLAIRKAFKQKKFKQVINP